MIHVAPWPEIVFALVAILVGTAGVRLLTPISSADRDAVELFLKNRSEELLRLRKVLIWWRSGPPGWGQGAVGLVTPLTPPYRIYQVVAQSADGQRWTHVLAASGDDGSGRAALMQRRGGLWSPASQ